MKFSVGQSLYSAVDATTVILVKAPQGEATITCGGVEMLAAKQASPSATAAEDQRTGSLLGKRYANDEVGIEMLCSKGGEGTLAVNGTPVTLKEAKPLPSSD